MNRIHEVEKPFVYYDDYPCEKIVGNKTGLKELSNSIATALEQGDETLVLNGEERLKIELREHIEEFYQTDNPSLIKKLLGYLTFLCFILWLVVLPFIGVSVLVHVVFFEEATTKNKPVPSYLAPLPKIFKETS